MVVEIGTFTGTTDGINISNYGDITVIQKAGDLYIGRIETNRSDLTPENIALGNVTVKALSGSIIGLNQNGKETEEPANITANNITLEAKKNISSLLTDLIQKEYQVSDKILTGKDGEELEDPKISFRMVKKNSETVDEDGNPITVTECIFRRRKYPDKGKRRKHRPRRDRSTKRNCRDRDRYGFRYS